MRFELGLSLLALLPACAPGLPPMQLDMSSAELAQPGVTCPRAMRFDPDRGCTGDCAGGAELRVVEQMRMSSAFVLLRALYVLDGHEVLYQWRADKPGERRRTPVFDAGVGPGEHVISVLLAYQGHGEGVFAYLRGYKFKVRSSHTLRLVDGEAVEVTVTAHEAGGLTTPLEERPAVAWSEAPGGAP